MKTRNEKAAALTAAEVKAQAQTKTLDAILAELVPVVKSVFPSANGRVERAVALIKAGAVLELRPINHTTGHQVFTVKGSNGNWYTVKSTGGCTCKDRQFNGTGCKHELAVWMTVRIEQAQSKRAGGNGSPPRPWECGCVLPGQSCPACEAAAREVYGEEML